MTSRGIHKGIVVCLAAVLATACSGGGDDDGGGGSSGKDAGEAADGSTSGDKDASTDRDASLIGPGKCPDGFMNCDGDRDTGENGCEADLDSVDHCGACDVACDAANANMACSSGSCTVTSCNSGYGDCDADPANGCEVDLSTVANCGSCGNDCGAGVCMGGSCTSPGCDTANTLTNDCDGDPTTGCETAVNTLTDCGNCRVVCALDNGTETCTTGSCEVDTCDTGYDDCDDEADNGCETALTSNTHCGACGVPCSFTNAAADCSTGTCTPGLCAPSFGDCNSDKVTDGCETLLRSVTHCNACDTPCAYANSVAQCDTGTCQFSACNQDWADVNLDTTMPSSTSDGCECQDVQSAGGTSCLNAINLGSIAVDAPPVTPITGTIAIPGREDWYVVTFPAGTRAGKTASIALTTNPGNVFKMTLLNACPSTGGGDYACGAAAYRSTDVTSWGWTDTCGGPGCSTGNLYGQAFGTPMPTIFYIKITRTGNARSCDQYVLTIDR